MSGENIQAELLNLASGGQTLDGFLSAALPRIANACDVDQVSIWAAVSGRWTQVATSVAKSSAGASTLSSLDDLLAESSDDGQPKVDGEHLAYPLKAAAWRTAVLVLSPAHPSLIERVSELIPCLQSVLGILQSTTEHSRRIERLESLLKIANSWYQIREMEPLLTRMAEVAAELLDAERATIFLWDRRRKQLVGRPALGVAGNELRISDDVGIVGRVLRTGSPARADSGNPSIAQNVESKDDSESDFQTRNLVCVPLISQRGRTLGAFEVLNKREAEFTEQDEGGLAELAVSAAAAIENCRNFQSLLASRNDDGAPAAIRLVGESPAMEKLRDVVSRVAPSDLPVLVLGENGTGKEVVSRQIHELSNRSKQPFLAVNCAALTKTLLESELFGHEKGAFTDAHQTRAGKFETASGGTLMLDEIGELPLDSQSKLLRVLDEQKVVRVGGTESHVIDTRVIAATNRDLGEMVRDRTFREDLFFRLNVVTLELPPLRERGDDVVRLAETFLEDFCEASGREVPRFTAAARKRLLRHAWPGNVRELRNVMERLAFLSSESEIDAEELPITEDPGASTTSGLPLSEATRQFQIDHIQSQIREAGGNMTEAARRLGLHRSNLYRKMGQLGLDSDEES